jgi:GDPmannose 4,6-dehydratase
MWLMLQQDEPDDYVLATGEAHSVREFVETAFAHVGRTIVWRGKDLEEKGFEKSTDRVLVEVDPRYFRPTEVDSLLGDASKARAKLGWRHKTTFATLVTDMVEADMKKIREERERRNRNE